MKNEESHDGEPNDDISGTSAGVAGVAGVADNATCVASCDGLLEQAKISLQKTKEKMKENDEACMQCCYDSAILKSILGKLRRIWSISPIALGMFNTVVKVNDIASSLSLIQPDSTWQYGQGIYWMSSRSREPSYSGSYGAPNTTLAIGNVMTFQYQTCKYSQPVSLKMGCDYSVYTAYTSFLVIWTVYFALLGAYHLYFSIPYSTYDLRFYLSAQLANSSPFNMHYVILGHVFTLVTVVVGWIFCFINLQAGIPGQESAAAGVGVFGVLNFLALVPFSSAIFSKMTVDKPVKLFYHPDRVFLSKIEENVSVVVLQKEKKQNYAPNWDEEPIEKGCYVSGMGIKPDTVVIGVSIDGEKCTVTLSTLPTISHETEVTFHMPHGELKGRQSDIFKADYAEHYEFVDPKIEDVLKERMEGKQADYRKGELQNGISCGACATVFGCNKLRKADALIYVDSIRTENGVTIYPGVYGYEKCGVIAMRQLRTTKGFLDEKRGVDISVIPEEKTIFNGWGAALNVESVFRELQEKVLRMSMIEDFIRNPENKLADTLPKAYDPTDDPPLDLFTYKEIEKKTKLSKTLTQFALYDSAMKMFEVLYMAEIKTDKLAHLVKEMKDEGVALQLMQQDAKSRLAAKTAQDTEKKNEEAQRTKTLPDLRTKIKAMAAVHLTRRRALKIADDDEKAAIKDLEQDLHWSASDENESTAADNKQKLATLKEREAKRITTDLQEKNTLQMQVKEMREKLGGLSHPSLTEAEIAAEMKPFTAVDEAMSGGADINGRAEHDYADGANSGSWLQRVAAWLFGATLPTTNLDCAAPAINCSTQVDNSV